MIEDRHHHSHKREQLASTLGQVIQQLITRGINDPRMVGIITVTGCEVAPDYSHAIVKISILPQKSEAKVMGGLRHAAGHLRRQARDRIHARAIPELRFELDSSLKRQAAVIGALSQVVAEREALGSGSTEVAESLPPIPTSPWVGLVRPPAPLVTATKPKKVRPNGKQAAKSGNPAKSSDRRASGTAASGDASQVGKQGVGMPQGGAKSGTGKSKPRRTAPKTRSSSRAARSGRDTR